MIRLRSGMSEQPNQRISQVTQVISRIANAGAFAIGLLGLAFWKFHWAKLAEWFPSLPDMTANTSFGFVLGGISLWLGRRPRGPVLVRQTGQVLALGVAVLGAMALCEFFFNWFPGFDEGLLRGPAGAPLPGRMSYLTALNFLLMGLGLLLLNETAKRVPHLGQFFTLVAIQACLLAVI